MSHQASRTQWTTAAALSTHSLQTKIMSEDWMNLEGRISQTRRARLALRRDQS